MTDDSHLTIAIRWDSLTEIPDERGPIGETTSKTNTRSIFWNCTVLRQMRHDLNCVFRKEERGCLFGTAESRCTDNEA